MISTTRLACIMLYTGDSICCFSSRLSPSISDAAELTCAT